MIFRTYFATKFIVIIWGLLMRLRTIGLLAVVALAGCAKLHQQNSVSLDVGESHNIFISAPVSEQKLKVTMASDQPVNIWVVLEKDIPGGAKDFDPATLKSGIVASSKGAKEASLDATIPAKEAYRIFLNGANKKANVNVTIDGK
jgi:hypothetical protein